MIKIHEWESNYFGFNIAYFYPRNNLFEFKKLEEFIKSGKIKFIWGHSSINNINIINKFKDYGFKYADLQICFKCEIGKLAINENMFQIAVDEDSGEIKNIAQKLFVDSRFYQTDFNSNKIKKLYQIWVEKAINGLFDDICLKIYYENRIAGFSTLSYSGKETSKIGLIGIRKEYQNRGLGKYLITSVFSFLKSENIKYVDVITQGKNYQAENFYIKNGFLLDSINIWFYKYI
jgi:dTDP-4-amino-4,6-dideoxy-D-galactose acyltransferase